MIYRKFDQYSTPETLLKLYVSTVRPHLEYGMQMTSSSTETSRTKQTTFSSNKT